MPLQQAGEPGQGDDPLHRLGFLHGRGVFLRLFLLLPAYDGIEILPDGLLDEHALGILGQYAQKPPVELPVGVSAYVPAPQIDLPPVRLAHTAQQGQGGALSRAVAPDQRVKFPLPHSQGEVADHIPALLLIAEPDVLHLYGQFFFGRPPDLLPQRDLFLFFLSRLYLPQGMGVLETLGGLAAHELGDPAPPFADGEGPAAAALLTLPAPRAVHPGVDLHGDGHGEEHPVASLLQLLSDRPRRALDRHLPGVHDEHLVRPGDHVLETVLREQHRGPDVPVDLLDRLQEIRGGDGIQLGGGLIQQQQLRVHGHDGRQVQELLLPSGQIRHIPIEPLVDAEVAGHLRHPQPDGGLVVPQALQAEGQLMPDLIRHDLIFRILQHIADLGALRPVIHSLKRRALIIDLPGALAVGSQHTLHLAHQGALAAAALAAQHIEGPLLYDHIHMPQRLPPAVRVGEAEVFYS